MSGNLWHTRGLCHPRERMSVQSQRDTRGPRGSEAPDECGYSEDRGKQVFLGRGNNVQERKSTESWGLRKSVTESQVGNGGGVPARGAAVRFIHERRSRFVRSSDCLQTGAGVLACLWGWDGTSLRFGVMAPMVGRARAHTPRACAEQPTDIWEENRIPLCLSDPILVNFIF